jgi:hypothetical protein
MGPRGLSVLERLLVRLCGRAPVGGVVIWAIDGVEPGCGRVWRTDQPGWLTMNATAGEVTVLSPDNDVLGSDTPAGAPSFADWTSQAPDAGPHLQSAEYPDRRHYGRYLRNVFEQLRSRAPASVRVQPVLGTATGLHQVGGSRWLTVEPGARRLRAVKIVLTTGHADLHLTSAEQELREHADSYRGLQWVGPGLVSEMALSQIPAGVAVAVRGMGLTFYDVLRSLTLGRGGRFGRAADGRLCYLPSGREPRVCAGSRGGLPFLARARVAQPPQTAPAPVALTGERLAVLRAAAVETRGTPQLDFAAEVEPLIQIEMDCAYYASLVRSRFGEGAAEGFAEAYRRSLEHTHPPDPRAVGEVLASYRLEKVTPVGFEASARPFDLRGFPGRRDFRRRLLRVLGDDVVESDRGSRSSPRKAAMEAVRALRPVLPSVVDFGGLLPGSHRDFLTRWAPMSFVLSAGPPASHVEQLAALVAAGVVEVVGPAAEFTVDRANRCFMVGSPAVRHSYRQARVLLEARTPTTDIRRDRAPLVRQLLGAV